MTNTNIKTRIIDTFVIEKAKTYSDYKKNTEKVLEEGLKEGGDWENVIRSVGFQKSMGTDKAYNGINQYVLGMVSYAYGYEDTRWLTFNDIKKHNEIQKNKENQWKLKAKDSEKGYQKGDQKCVEIMYFIPRYFYEVDKNGNIDWKNGRKITETEFKALSDDEKKRVKPKTIKSYVFNAEQVEGIEPEVKEVKNYSVKLVEYIAKGLGVSLDYKGQGQPCYIPSRDRVSLPPVKFFKNQKYLYSASLHEFAHSTGHSSRLNRDIKNLFGSEDYALEELVAETTSAMLCAYLGIEHEVDKNHKTYVKSWLNACKTKPNALLDAFKLAEQATDYIIDETNLADYEEKVVVTETVTEEKPKKASKETKKYSVKKTTRKTATKKAVSSKTTKKESNLKMTSDIVNGIEYITFTLTKEDGNIAWLKMTRDFYMNMSKKEKKAMEKAWGVC